MARKLVSRLNLPSGDQFRTLFTTANKLKNRLPPLMIDQTVFTIIEQKDSEDLLFINFFRIDDQCFGCNIYTGFGALLNYLKILKAPPDVTQQLLIANQSCLTCYFGPTFRLSSGDLSAMEEAGYTPADEDDAIYFRSYRPGYVPWYLDGEEAAKMIFVLEQVTAAVDDMINQRWEIDFRQGLGLTRHYQPATDTYETIIGQMPEITVEHQYLVLEDDLFTARLKKQPRTGITLEGDFLYIATPVRNSTGDRLLFPCLCLLANRDGGTIDSQTVLEEGDEIQDVFIDLLVAYIMEYGRPRRLVVRSGELFYWLQDLCTKCGIALEEASELMIIDDFMTMLVNGPPQPDFDSDPFDE